MSFYLPKSRSFTSRDCLSPSLRSIWSISRERSSAARSSALNVHPMLQTSTGTHSSTQRYARYSRLSYTKELFESVALLVKSSSSLGNARKMKPRLMGASLSGVCACANINIGACAVSAVEWGRGTWVGLYIERAGKKWLLISKCFSSCLS